MFFHGAVHVRSVMLFAQFPDAPGAEDPAAIARQIVPRAERWVREVSRARASLSVPSGRGIVRVLPADDEGDGDEFSPCASHLLPDAAFRPAPRRRSRSRSSSRRRDTFVDRASGFRVRVVRRERGGWRVRISVTRRRR